MPMNNARKGKAMGVRQDDFEADDVPEESSDLESAFLDAQGAGTVSHGRRVRGRGLDENELGDLPDEAPPGWPG